METFYLDHDIRLCCISAASFPGGVMDAYQRLHNLFPDYQTRRVYGIAWPDGQGSMIYKAGVEEAYPGELKLPLRKATGFRYSPSSPSD